MVTNLQSANMVCIQLNSARVVAPVLLLFVALFDFTPMEPCDARPIMPKPAIRPPLIADVARKVKSLAGRQFNLDFCDDVVVKLAGKRINRKRCRLSTHDAITLAPMLEQEGIYDRAYVWCRMAELYHSLSKNVTKFDVRELDKFEGDIDVCRDDVDMVLAPFFPTERQRIEAYDNARNYKMASSKRRFKRKLLPFKTEHWRGAIIPYKIKDPKLSALTVVAIREAIQVWEKDTCIRFYETDKIFFQPHIHFRKGSGCSSRIGRKPNGQQVSVGEGCESVGIISHEIGHVLGFYHEHSRPDRDLYVDILKDNIIGDIEQFSKLSWDSGMTLGIPYDYASVMHYGNLDFSVDGIAFSMVAKQREMQRVLGQRQGPSFLDFKLANWNYCSGACDGKPLEWDACQNGGYRNPNDCETCLCPSGLGGSRCEMPGPGVNSDCGEQMLFATYENQELKSPGYDTDDGMDYNAYCSWLIQASTPGKRVRLQFVEDFVLTDDPSLCEDFVEVRYKGLMMPGPRLCGEDPPEKVFASHGSQVLIAVNTLHVDWWQGFKLLYKEENCGGCSIDASPDEPFCLRTVEYDCSPETNCTGNACPPSRKNVCYREEEYCCVGYVRHADRCLRDVFKVVTVTSTTSDETTGKPRTSAATQQSTTSTTTQQTTPTTSTTTTERPTTSTTTTERPTSSTTTTERPTTSATTERPPALTTTQRPKTSSATTTSRQRSTAITSHKPTSVQGTTHGPVYTTSTTTPQINPKPRTEQPSVFIEGTWSEWREWSPCSSSCGMCGRSSRTRTCMGDGPCRGKPEEWKHCGEGLCPPVVTERKFKCMETKPNCSSVGWYLAVKKDCKIEKTCTVMETAKPCCIGRPTRGQCHR